MPNYDLFLKGVCDFYAELDRLEHEDKTKRVLALDVRYGSCAEGDAHEEEDKEASGKVEAGLEGQEGEDRDTEG